MFGRQSLAILAVSGFVVADIINNEFAEWTARGEDEDLWRFVSRPDLTPPRLRVVNLKPEKTAPGYIFVGPYDCLDCGRRATTSYVTQQIGPTIYTQDGELVWSGKDLFPDRKVFDFKPLMIDDRYHLALVAPQDSEWHVFADGAAIVLDDSYEISNSVNSTELGHKIDLHEFNIVDEGQTALISSKSPREDLPIPKSVGWKGTRVMEIFFDEINLRTQEQTFHWRASDHVSLEESSNPPPPADSEQKHWDWFHLNSIDKDMNGDFLVSARATNTIYLISRKDGSPIWRLGGKNSSFAQDFEFSRQHHARIRKQTRKQMTITFFDNAADDSGVWEPTSDSSGLMIVALDLENMVAKVNHRHARPDGGHSLAKGNVEYLPNGNVLGGWGENAYITEYSKPGGELVYEASFLSHRFANYRTYKGEFVASPNTKPDIKALATVDSKVRLTTTIYVSWNGATEVTEWRFFAHSSKGKVELGRIAKYGFETYFVATGYHPIVYVEAMDIYGKRLSQSEMETTELPIGFHNEASPLYKQARQATETDLLLYTAVAFIAGISFMSFWTRFHTNRQGFVKSIISASWGRKGKTNMR